MYNPRPNLQHANVKYVKNIFLFHYINTVAEIFLSYFIRVT
jgi:hypothetical protein